MFEQYIGGQEIQAAVLNNTALGAIELIPKELFMIIKLNIQSLLNTKHIMPARLNKKNILKVLKIARKPTVY